MPDELVIDVIGTPAPQGSKKAFYNAKAGRAVIVEDNDARKKSWRKAVTDTGATVADTHPDLVHILKAGPIRVEVDFYLPRPGYHFGTGKNARRLKPTAPSYVDKKPDVDKLLRSTLDGLKEAGVYRDDAQVAVAVGTKRYADAATGAHIVITSMAGDPEPTATARPVTTAEGRLW